MNKTACLPTFIVWCNLADQWYRTGQFTLKIEKICFSPKVSIQPCWSKSDSALLGTIWAQSGPKKLHQKAIPTHMCLHHPHFLIFLSFKRNIVAIKVARSDFWVTIPFNFERLELHHYQSNRKSNVSGVLEKDESLKLGTFHQDPSYHSNEMTPCPILHNTE